MECTSKLRIVYGDYTLGVHGEGFDYVFSYSQGGLESVVKNGYEWLYRCPKPTFWRALTDNDRGSKFHIKSGSWLAADMFIDCMMSDVLLKTEGVSRVHGGGFAGTIQAFVKNDFVVPYKLQMDSIYGEGSCKDLRIRKYGGIKVM